MSNKFLVSRSSQRMKRGQEVRIREAAKSRKWAKVADIAQAIAAARTSGKPVMIDLQQLANSFSVRTVPAVVAKNIRIKKARIDTGLIIDIGFLGNPIQRPPAAEFASSKEALLSNDEMLDLQEVMAVLNAAGRSSVHAMEATNRVFGLLPPGRMRGKRYPKWQFDAGIAGEPLRLVLSYLDSLDS
jgi:hypothetical protein